jgi:hypothetical protein
MQRTNESNKRTTKERTASADSIGVDVAPAVDDDDDGPRRVSIGLDDAFVAPVDNDDDVPQDDDDDDDDDDVTAAALGGGELGVATGWDATDVAFDDVAAICARNAGDAAVAPLPLLSVAISQPFSIGIQRTTKAVRYLTSCQRSPLTLCSCACSRCRREQQQRHHNYQTLSIGIKTDDDGGRSTLASASRRLASTTSLRSAASSAITCVRSRSRGQPDSSTTTDDDELVASIVRVTCASCSFAAMSCCSISCN